MLAHRWLLAVRRVFAAAVLYIRMYIRITYIYVCMYVYVYMYVYIYIHMYVCMYVYIYIHNLYLSLLVGVLLFFEAPFIGVLRYHYCVILHNNDDGAVAATIHTNTDA